MFLCYASILKWFRHSCNRCLNSNQILLIDPLPFHSFLNLNTELLLHAWLHFPKFTCSWVIKYYIEFWAYVVESLQNYGKIGFGISSPSFKNRDNNNLKILSFSAYPWLATICPWYVGLKANFSLFFRKIYSTHWKKGTKSINKSNQIEDFFKFLWPS